MRIAQLAPLRAAVAPKPCAGPGRVSYPPPQPSLPGAIVTGAFALLQMIVRLRLFLHIAFSGKREDLQLTLLAMRLLIGAGSTAWIMGSRALRMAQPAQP